MSQTFFLENKKKDRSSSDDQKLIGSILMKLLQRGYSPFSTIEIENKILEKHNLNEIILTLSRLKIAQNTLNQNSKS